MTTRSIKQLLQLLLDNQQLFITGICNWNLQLLHSGIITSLEVTKAIRYLEDNLPTRQYGSNDMYSWPPFKIEPRIAWIQEQIKLLS